MVEIRYPMMRSVRRNARRNSHMSLLNSLFRPPVAMGMPTLQGQAGGEHQESHKHEKRPGRRQRRIFGGRPIHQECARHQPDAEHFENSPAPREPPPEASLLRLI
jgi:hypothetical protein